jgi:hypothetical protein
MTRYTQREIVEAHGCLTGDCPHMMADQCITALKDVLLEQADVIEQCFNILRAANEPQLANILSPETIQEIKELIEQ